MYEKDRPVQTENFYGFFIQSMLVGSFLFIKFNFLQTEKPDMRNFTRKTLYLQLIDYLDFKKKEKHRHSDP